MRSSDWSSDVSSSDLVARKAPGHQPLRLLAARHFAGQARHNHDQAAPVALRRTEKAIARFRRMSGFEPVCACETAQNRIAVRLDDRLAVGRYAVLEFRSEEHTSELQSLMRISYAVFCLKKKKIIIHKGTTR